MSNCGVVYATGLQDKPAARCSKRAEKGKGSPCKEHRRHLELLNAPGREQIKARYEALVWAFESYEQAAKGKDTILIINARANLRVAARGGAAQ